MANTLALLIQHPSVEAEAISKGLGVEPSYARGSGEPVVTPNGEVTGGHYRWTAWSFEVDLDEDETREQVQRVLGIVEAHATFVRELTSSGGRVTFTVRADQGDHVVVVLGQADLALLASRDVQVAFEVFSSS